MSYSAEISRTHPALFGFLIDESYSMQEELDGGAGRRAGHVHTQEPARQHRHRRPAEGGYGQAPCRVP